MDKIGNAIRKIRKQKGMTLSELSKASGVSRTHLTNLENNKFNPSNDTTAKIAEALDISPAALIGGSMLTIENNLKKQIEENINKRKIEQDLLLKLYIEHLSDSRFTGLNKSSKKAVIDNLIEEISYFSMQRINHYDLEPTYADNNYE